MKKLELFKKGTAFCITCAMIFSSALIYASDSQTTNEAASQDGIRKTEILFRDIPWYSTKKDVEEELFANGAKEAGWMSNPNEIYGTGERVRGRFDQLCRFFWRSEYSGTEDDGSCYGEFYVPILEESRAAC